MFLSELCDILGIARPDPTSPDPENNRYVFDRAITRIHPDGTAVTNYIDFYKAAHFLWETKQGFDESSGDRSSDLRSPLTKIGHGRRGTLPSTKPSSALTTKPATTSPTSPQATAARPYSSSAMSAIPSTLRGVHLHRRALRAFPRSPQPPHPA